MAFSKKFGQTVMMLLEENLLNAVKSHTANKRSLLYALYAPCKVYSINNYMLFCSPQMKWLEFLMPLLKLPARGDAHFLLSPKAPFSSDCFQYFFILLVSFKRVLAACIPERELQRIKFHDLFFKKIRKKSKHLNSVIAFSS